MALTAETFWSEVAKEAGLPDDKVKALVDSVSDEKLMKALENRVMMRSDYSRGMDKVREGEKRNEDYYKCELTKAAQNKELFDRQQAELQRYQELYGAIGDGGNGNGKAVVDTAVIDGLRKDFQGKLDQLSTNAVGVIKDAMWCSGDYLKRFGEVLDPAALEAHAVQTKLPLKLAYEDMIKPRMTELEKSATDKRVKEAYEQGAKDTASKYKLPTPESAPREPHPFFDSYRAADKLRKESGAPTGRTLRDNFVSHWQEAAAAPKS